MLIRNKFVLFPLLNKFTTALFISETAHFELILVVQLGFAVNLQTSNKITGCDQESYVQDHLNNFDKNSSGCLIFKILFH